MSTIFSTQTREGERLPPGRLFARLVWIWVKILAVVALGHTETVSFVYAGF